MNLEYVESSYEMLMLMFVYHSDFFGIFAFVCVVVEVVRGGGQFIMWVEALPPFFLFDTRSNTREQHAQASPWAIFEILIWAIS